MSHPRPSGTPLPASHYAESMMRRDSTIKAKQGQMLFLSHEVISHTQLVIGIANALAARKLHALPNVVRTKANMQD